jgi:heme a synthase
MSNALTLIDLAPLFQMMLMGLGVALGPLAWIWLRNRHANAQRRLHALTLLTLFLTFDLVLFGAFTRLTDSGLGCPDWPGCYSQATPLAASHAIAAAQAAMPTGPVTHGKAWIEMIHRYLATGVGVLILTLALSAWMQRWAGFRAARRASGRAGAAVDTPIHWFWPTLTLVWVCLQGAFGALTVTMKLFPAIVTLHLLGGLGLLALLMHQADGYQRAAGSWRPVLISPGLRGLMGVAAGLLLVQIALGGWVSTNYAVLACSEFPTCQGSWWPAMNFAQGFEWWRELGHTAAGEPIAFDALTAIHYVHRLSAYGVFAVLAVLTHRLFRQEAGRLRRAAGWLASLLVLQLLTGLSNVVLGWPLLAAVAHTGGAAGLVVVMTHLFSLTRGGHSSTIGGSGGSPPHCASTVTTGTHAPSHRS